MILRLVLLLLLTSISMLATQASAEPPSTETLRIGVHLGSMRDVSRGDVDSSMKVWAQEMMKTLEVPAVINFYTDLHDLERDLTSDKINFVIADGVNLIRSFNLDELTDGFGGGGPDEGSMVLLARKDSKIKTEHDLQGKRVSLLSQNDISDLMLDTTCLREFHKTCAQAGLRISKEARSRQQVLQLFFGKVDAALVREVGYDLSVELNPQIRNQTAIIKRLPIYPGALGFFSIQVSAPFRDYVITKAPLIQNYPRGRQILDVMQTARIVRFPKSILDPIRDLMREHDRLLTRYQKRASAR